MALNLLIAASNPAVPEPLKQNAISIANFAIQVANTALKESSVASISSAVIAPAPVTVVPPPASFPESSQPLQNSSEPSSVPPTVPPQVIYVPVPVPVSPPPPPAPLPPAPFAFTSGPTAVMEGNNLSPKWTVNRPVALSEYTCVPENFYGKTVVNCIYKIQDNEKNIIQAPFSFISTFEFLNSPQIEIRTNNDNTKYVLIEILATIEPYNYASKGIKGLCNLGNSQVKLEGMRGTGAGFAGTISETISGKGKYTCWFERNSVKSGTVEFEL